MFFSFLVACEPVDFVIEKSTISSSQGVPASPLEEIDDSSTGEHEETSREEHSP